MPTETLSPSAIISSTNLDGDVTDIDEPISVWTPAEFPSLTGWWDSDDLSDQGDGTDVTTWADKSGNSRDWVQRSGPQPYPDKEPDDGHAVVDFLESNAEALAQATTLATVIGDTGLVAVVAEMTGSPSTGVVGFYVSNGVFVDSGGYYAVAAHTDTGTPKWVFGIYDGADKVISLTATAGQRQLLLMYRTADPDGNLTASVDGGTESTLAAGAPQVQSAGMAIGQSYNVASPACFNGKICEIVTSTGNGTSDDRVALIAYLKAKWGIT